jgi:hypothetical protein
MDDLILDIFYKEIISELNTKKGKIKIQDNLYYFPFSVAIEEEKIPSSSYELSDDFSFAPPVLMIRDKESFEPLLVEFIKQQLQLINEEENLRHYLTLCCGENIHNQIKYLLLLVWKNATSEDFIHPQAFLTKRIQFFTKEDITTPLEAPLDMNQGLGIVSEVKRQFASLETPYYLDSKIISYNQNGNGESYPLPQISYGISDKVAYLYSIKGKKRPRNENKTSFFKKIDRYLYKANDHVQDSEEYQAYKEKKTDYYPENISDISVSALYSLTMFLKHLERNGITKLVTTSFLPLRYLAKEQAINESISLFRFLYNHDRLEEIKNEELAELARDTKNQTEKLIRTLRRLSYHFPNLEIASYPFEVDSNLHMEITQINHYEEEHILTDLYNQTNSVSKSK